MTKVKITNRIVYISGILCMASGLIYNKVHGGWMAWFAGLVIGIGASLVAATTVTWRNYDR